MDPPRAPFHILLCDMPFLILCLYSTPAPPIICPSRGFSLSQTPLSPPSSPQCHHCDLYLISCRHSSKHPDHLVPYISFLRWFISLTGKESSLDVTGRKLHFWSFVRNQSRGQLFSFKLSFTTGVVHRRQQFELIASSLYTQHNVTLPARAMKHEWLKVKMLDV